MAIEKEITHQNGVAFNYHRVVSVNGIANRVSLIEVASYINRQQRENERAAIANAQPFDVMVSTCYVEAPYDPNMGITGAYQYIKGIEPYNDPQDVFEDGNDPVAFADAVASGSIDIEDIPESQRSEIEALIQTKPAEKEGFITVAHVEPMGYRIVWTFEPDPNYDPDAEDGTYLKPFKYEQGMAVVAGKWYWLADKELPHEAIADGVPTDFYDTDFFEYVEEPPQEPADEPQADEAATEPETQEPSEQETPSEPDAPTADGQQEATAEVVEKQPAAYGDYINPIEYAAGTSIEAGLWYYADDPDLPREALQDGTPDGFDDPAYFDIVG